MVAATEFLCKWQFADVCLNKICYSSAWRRWEYFFSAALLCSDFCQAPIFYFAKRHFEKTLDNIVSGIATLLYVDWLPQCNGFAVSATI